MKSFSVKPGKFNNPGMKGFTSGGTLKKAKLPKVENEYFPKKKFLEGLSRRGVFAAGAATGGTLAGGGAYIASEQRRMKRDREQAHEFLMRTDPRYRANVQSKNRTSELSSLLDDLIEFADPRPRNPLGEFTQQEGGPDPNAMARVYKMPQQQPGGGSTAATLLAGGAVGAFGGAIGKAGYEELAKHIKRIASKKRLR